MNFKYEEKLKTIPRNNVWHCKVCPIREAHLGLVSIFVIATRHWHWAPCDWHQTVRLHFLISSSDHAKQKQIFTINDIVSINYLFNLVQMPIVSRHRHQAEYPRGLELFSQELAKSKSWFQFSLRMCIFWTTWVYFMSPFLHISRILKLEKILKRENSNNISHEHGCTNSK